MKKPRRNFHGNPLAYYLEHFGDRRIPRGRLSKEDPGLSQALKRAGQLEKATFYTSRRFYGNPFAYFQEHLGHRDFSSGQLAKEDSYLCEALRKKGQLDYVVTKRYDCSGGRLKKALEERIEFNSGINESSIDHISDLKQEILNEFIDQVLGCLGKKERRAVLMRLREGKTLDKIASKLKFNSKQYAFYCINEALAKIQEKPDLFDTYNQILELFSRKNADVSDYYAMLIDLEERRCNPKSKEYKWYVGEMRR